MRIIAGLVLVALGLLWSLQGADLVHIEPILCVANCEPVTGGSALWLAIGLVTLGIGLALLWIRKGKPKR